MKHLYPFQSIMPIFMALFVQLFVLQHARATNCANTVDIFIDDPKTKQPLKGRTLLLYTEEVNLKGRMEIAIFPWQPNAGDSCILTFKQPGFTRYIGAGLTLKWDNYSSQNNWGCGYLFTSIYGNGNFKWNGAFDGRDYSIGYESAGAHHRPWTPNECNPDKLKIEFTITGRYTGEKLELKPTAQREGPWNGHAFNSNGWYVIAAKQDAGCRGCFTDSWAFWGNSSGLAPLVVKEDPCRVVNKRSIKRHKMS